VAVRVNSLEFEGALDGVGAAYPAAIGAIRLARAYALNENRRLHGLKAGVPALKAPVEFLMGQDPAILAVKVLLWLVFLGAGCQDRNAMFKYFRFRTVLNRSAIVAHITRHLSD